MAPIRISNLVGIRLDKHLIKVGGALHLVFQPEEVKNEMASSLCYPHQRLRFSTST